MLLGNDVGRPTSIENETDQARDEAALLDKLKSQGGEANNGTLRNSLVVRF
jgi:hypothetical protein